MKKRVQALLIGLMLAGGSSIHAYITNLTPKGASVRWFLSQPSAFVSPNSVNRSKGAIRYYLQQDAFSEANRDAELNAVRASFAQWAAIPGTSIDFEDAGLITGEIDINDQDSTNVVFWAKSTTVVNGGRSDIRGRLAVTFRSGFVDIPVIAEADIVFNGTDENWYTDFFADETERKFIEGVAVHEIGHWLGVAHSTVGAATMNFDSGASGIGTVVGLSPDEFAFADQFYGTPEKLATRGALSGVITKDGTPIYGATIVLEDVTGSVITGGISRQQSSEGPDGHYIVQGVPPGDYQVRVLPMQPDGVGEFLTIPGIIPLPNSMDIDTQFLPSAAMSVSITAGETAELDIAVENGQPPFYITGIRGPTTNGFSFSLLRSGVSLRQGDQDYVVGVYGSTLPAEGATLSITGPGITISPSETRGDLFPPLNHIFAIVNVAEDAPTGFRTFIIRKGDEVAYAPGFLEIQPKTLDYNYDGLDDRFQRRFFDPFTHPDAAPDADPDGDGFPNSEEAEGDSNPTEAQSIPVPQIVVEPFEILSIALDASGSQVTFASVEGAQYQLFSRQSLDAGDWVAVGDPITATGATTTVLDASATEAVEFYRVESLP